MTPEATTATVDVCIVAYASQDVIEPCLDAATAIPGLGKIVVIDHFGDNTLQRAARFPVITVQNLSNPGFGAGQNRARALTDAPYLLILNPDAVVNPTAIAAGLALMEAEPSVAACQGVIHNTSTGDPERSAGRSLTPLHLWGRSLSLKRLLRFGLLQSIAARVPSLHDTAHRIPDGPTDVETLAATALLARRTALDDVGGFDERYFLYGEDLDLCCRLRQRGWRLISLPNPWAEHSWGTSSRTEVLADLEWWHGTMLYAAKWFPPSAWVMALGAATLRAIRSAATLPPQVPSIISRGIAEPIRYRQVFKNRVSR